MRFSIKTFLPRTLLGRSLMILATPILLIQVISTYVFFDRHWNKMADRLSDAVAGEIAIIADQIEISTDSGHIKQLSGYAQRNLSLRISFEPDGRFSESPGPVLRSPVAQVLAASLADQIKRPNHVKEGTGEKLVRAEIQLNNGLLKVSVPQKRLFSSSGYVFLLWMVGSSLILTLIAMLFMRNQIRPIRRLAVVAERFGRGLDVPASFKPEGAHEVRQAARAFLEMHARIKRQIEQRTAMLAGVSHDLRTPLTRMKLQTAMMEPGPDIEALKGDIADMERMINAYLDFARGQGGEQAVRTDLREMLERIVSGIRRQGAPVELETSGDLSVQVRPVAFERALDNIVGNARKYASHIWVSGRRAEDGIEIRVDDDGPGIPEDQYEEMFKPFVRGEPSRNPSTGGVGLGLPIAQDVVLSHGGQIGLARSERGGLKVVIRIPA